MPVTIDQRRIDDLVARPTESLNVEIKRWINPERCSAEIGSVSMQGKAIGRLGQSNLLVKTRGRESNGR
jgi:hypothetical protein